MSRDDADNLQELLEQGRDQWPLKQELPVIARVAEWQAFSESNGARLQQLANWQAGQNQNLAYIVDPLPERIKDAFADLIFGADTDFETPTVETGGVEQPGPDQELLDDIIDENDLPSELQAAAAQCVAEGEVWWRVYVDRDAYEHPVIEWHSRADVLPLYRGKRLLACAFISDLSNLAPDAPVVRTGDDADPAGTAMWVQNQAATDGDGTVWRYVEIQAGGLTRNLLYRGTRSTLGDRQDLGAHPQTEDLPDEWLHGLTSETLAGRTVPVMLAGRVANGKAGRLGRSQYAGVRDLLYELNKLQSVGARNVELTMQKRAVFANEVVAATVAQALARNPDADPEDVARRVHSALPVPDSFMAPVDSMGENSPMGVLEFSDAWADALLAWDGGLTDKILTRCRVAPQLVGRHTEDAATGPALRARLLDSVLAADGKARAWDDALPKLLQVVQLVDALPEEQGGCGHQWADPFEPPTVIRSSILPEDESEEVTRHATAVGARLESRRTAISRLNPEWDDERIDSELAMIGEDVQAAAAAVAASNPSPPSFGVTQAGGNGAGR